MGQARYVSRPSHRARSIGGRVADVLLNRIFAGFHTDMNFLTIHGQSRYPGCKLSHTTLPPAKAEPSVNIWARNSGKRLAVRIPPGCLLVQAGKQLEWASGGLVKGASTPSFCSHFNCIV